MRIANLAIAAAAALAAGPALAGTLEPAPAPEPIIAPAPAAPSADWSGFYVGGQLGYGFGELSFDVDDFDLDGVIGGFHAGYLWDTGQFVFGPEIQYDFADLTVTDADGNTGSFDEILRLKLRGGAEVGPRGLVFGSVGAAYANFDGVGGVLDIDFDDPGLVLGFGYEHQITDQWSIGGEYQWHQFDDFGAPDNDVNLQTIHLRASFNF